MVVDELSGKRFAGSTTDGNNRTKGFAATLDPLRVAGGSGKNHDRGASGSLATTVSPTNSN